MGLGRVWLGRAGVVTVVIGVGLTLAMTSGCSSSKSEELDTESSLTSDEFGGEGSLAKAGRGERPGGGRFEEVYFGYDSSDLDSSGTDAVRANADLMRRDNGRVEIEGHCDERGTAEYNLALGARRAKAIRDGLVAVGVSASRLSTVSYGEELPVCRESSDSCWSQNRRGHLVDLTE